MSNTANTAEFTSSSAMLDRPFYFIVVLWGERFRSYFLDFCLASLLAPGNIPALKTAVRSKFLIATRPEDWQALQDSEMFRLLGRYVEPIYIEIPPCPPGRTGCQHMGVGHRLACEMAHGDRAYAAVLTPDCMLSDGSVARLQELARLGTELVITAALRFGEEPFLGRLQEIGALPSATAASSRAPLAISGRQMVNAAVNGFHSETLAYEWDAPGVLIISPAAWWRVPGEDGIVLHSLSWAPLLLDFAAVAHHDTSTFDQWTLDGDYLFNNSSKITKIHVVQDSDELFLASWGPMADRPVQKLRIFLEKYLAGRFFTRSFYSGVFDPLKRREFFLPVRWHSKPLNDQWTEVEALALRELRRWVEPPDELPTNGAASHLKRAGAIAKDIPLAALTLILFVWLRRRNLPKHLGGVLRGDRETLKRIVWFMRTYIFVMRHSSRPVS